MSDRMDRVTLFLPTGERIAFLVKQHGFNDKGVLHYTNMDGDNIFTTLPYAIELDIHQGQKAAPFAEGATR